MFMKLKKDTLKNKQLVSNLNKRMFLGYTTLKNLNSQKNNKTFTLYNPKKKYLPFEYEYQSMYKDKFINKYKPPIFLDANMSIINYSKSPKNVESLLNKILITQNLKDNSKSHIKAESSVSSPQNISKKIFSNESEEQLFNQLPFFSLYKNKKSIGYNKTMNNNKNPKEINEKILKEDFLYKISHDNSKFNNDIKDIQKLKAYTSLQFKKRYKEKKDLGFENKNKIKNGNPNLELKAKNVTPENLKVHYLNNKEKHLNFISNKLSVLQSIPNNLMKNFNEFLNSIDIEIEKQKEGKEKENIKSNESSYKSLISEIDNDSIHKINVYKISSNRGKIYNNFIPYRNKKIKKYPPNFYSLQQMMIKNKKYEAVHQKALNEFRSKINLKNDYERNLNYMSSKEIYRPLTLGVLEPPKNLLRNKKMTHKMAYLTESRIRDIILSKTLKCEYDSVDIKRVLNGKKPWKLYEDDKDIKNKTDIEFNKRKKKK